ncbi:hypothetical protein MSAN_02424600 [Mycena sanguinolenta]|uniref:Uncharacterized protein n=1 Tax=Mycena sanguinolenta TaxID=230812 RepID=A0A8H7CDL0_9AGAR|nr:hypothetical protein MSAN_02424600 [Mycena sanguinolenta]
MPVSFPVATHPAKPYQFTHGRAPHTAPEFFAMACKDQNTKAGEMLQFSLPDANGSTDASGGRNMTARIPNVVPNRNGFVATVLDAYTQDRALVIRPDDVWLAILCQFNFFVNGPGRAELLRANFVAHEGKQELVITAMPATRYTVDFGSIARQMADLVEKNVVDPTLRAWATPDFTTTTQNDRTVSAVMLMATLKQYFDYTVILFGCGIPRVTLEGEKSDWENILDRLEKLKEYGLETTAWYHLLRPVISRFVGAFDDPTNPENVDFWQRVAHFTPGGSGMGNYYTGWISAFTVFDKEGRWIGNELNDQVSVPDPTALTAEQFWKTYETQWMRKDMILDGSPYHRLYRGGIPPGCAEVDILLIDNGVRFDCAMVAGSVGTRVVSSDDKTLSAGGKDDTVSPVLGWWLFVKDENEEKMRAKAKEAAKRRDY